ncbi:hypothetical protein GGX14DRAFT_437036 [Mycena pura]|uniref:Uncharacterized protein n=1 Tax=Mycena pura TaxID=153505 RepID=A0AAD6YGC7_9AGAR|nr:hypothetical protein GGX14DRAFT_437036 [Mycena pura]
MVVLPKEDSDSPPPYSAEPYGAEPFNQPTESAGEPHVYYRVYTPSGAVRAKTAATASDDQFLGRIPARAVPPPHNVASLKRCLARAERCMGVLRLAGLGAGALALYADPYAAVPMRDDARLELLGPGATHGAAPETPLVVVLPHDLPATEAAADDLAVEDAREHTQYLYYRLYTPVGEVASTRAFVPGDPSLGRIPKARVARPYDPQTITRCIARAEGKPLFAGAQLFQDVTADAPIEAYVGEGAGSSADRPLVLVRPQAHAHCPRFQAPFAMAHHGPDATVLLRHLAGMQRQTRPWQHVLGHPVPPHLGGARFNAPAGWQRPDGAPRPVPGPSQGRPRFQ